MLTFNYVSIMLSYYMCGFWLFGKNDYTIFIKLMFLLAVEEPRNQLHYFNIGIRVWQEILQLG